MKLALGTVQFGLPYGISNQVGQVSFNAVNEILSHASLAGMDTIDTAIAYGESEAVLGQVGVDNWRVVSKLPAFPAAEENVADWVQNTIDASILRLKLSKLYGVLLHCPSQLRSPSGNLLYQALLNLKKQGKVDKIGISVYEPAELDLLLSTYDFDIIQIPFNVLDQRFATSGWLNRLSQQGTEIHARSAFLQGLLLMQAKHRPVMFNRWAPLWQKWERLLATEKLTPLQACLGFVMSQPEIDRVIVGVESLKQLQEILNVAIPAKFDHQTLATEDPELLNPSNWRKYHDK
jgi:aryl-alcohol dehydrogenase-like predicted oxidoreductase